MSNILWTMGEKTEAKNILHNVLEVYPNNNAITFQLLNYQIKDSIELVQNIKKLNEMKKKVKK